MCQIKKVGFILPFIKSFPVRATHSSPNESYIIFTPWDTQPILVSTNALYWKERNKSWVREGGFLHPLVRGVCGSVFHPLPQLNHLLVVRIRFAIFTIVRLIPQARTWETLRRVLMTRLFRAYAPPILLYSDRIILYLQLSRST